MLGERIREIRKKNQMNQMEFSNRVGVSQGTLSELEQNKYNPSLETILAIIKEFNVNATWLLFGDAASGEGLKKMAGELNSGGEQPNRQVQKVISSRPEGNCRNYRFKERSSDRCPKRIKL